MIEFRNECTCIFERSEHVGALLVKTKILRIDTPMDCMHHMTTYVFHLLTVTESYESEELREMVDVSEDWEAQLWALRFWEDIGGHLVAMLGITAKELGYNQETAAADIPF